jgi:hypothetical protein
MKAKIIPFRKGDLEIRNPKNHFKFCHLIFYKHYFSFQRVNILSKFSDEINYSSNGMGVSLPDFTLNIYRREL